MFVQRTPDTKEPARSRGTRRVFALTIGIALAIGALLLWRATRPNEAPQHARSAVRALLLERSRATIEPARTDVDESDPRARPWWIPEADARLLFAVSTRGQRYDPWTYHAAIPGLDQEVVWPEHAGGSFRYRANARGLREDAEVAPARGDLRVLVTGDSHSAGFCDNSESFSNVLEARLARRHPERKIDVVNAANMGFSFHNYLGALEKYRDLRPHVFVVVVHGGNDFHEVLLPYRYLHRLPPPAEDEALYRKRGDAEMRFPAALFQGAWSTASFRAHPEERALASTAADEVFDRIRALCAEDGIRLVVALIPSPLEVEGDLHADSVDPVLSSFGTTRRDVAEHGELGRELLHRLERSSVACVDAMDALRESGAPSFWREDLHLSVAGHERMARVLEPIVAASAGFDR